MSFRPRSNDVIQLHQYRQAVQQSVRQVYTQWSQREPLLVQLRRQLAVPNVQIGVCLIGSTLVWAAYLATVYALPSLACQWQWVGAPGPERGLKLLQRLISVMAAGAIAGVGYVVFAHWQQTRKAGYTELGQAKAAQRTLLAFVTLFLNTFYLLCWIYAYRSCVLP